MTRPPPDLTADVLALEVLGFLAETHGTLEDFAAETGITLAEMRAQASEPQFLAAVMDFLLTHEDLARGFCMAHSISAESLHRARRRLPGL